MKSFFKNKIVTVLILVATLVLAGIAIFTAIRLYQLRQQPVAPTAPTSEPKAAPPASCTQLTFTLTGESPSQTPPPSPHGHPHADRIRHSPAKRFIIPNSDSYSIGYTVTDRIIDRHADANF